MTLGPWIWWTILSHAEKPILTRQMRFFFQRVLMVHDWFMIDSWLIYVFLEIRPFQGTSTWILETKTRWAAVISFCGVPVRCKPTKIDDSSVVSFWLKFTLPSIIMGFSWKMGVSPIWVSFHLESHFPLKQICFTETIPKFRVNRWITDPNHLIMGVKGLSQLPNRNSLTREMQLIPEGAGVLPGWKVVMSWFRNVDVEVWGWKHPGRRLQVFGAACLPAGSCLYIYTSRAARGGGGSFKNRKRIGEIGCCESRMTKKITDGSD